MTEEIKEFVRWWKNRKTLTIFLITIGFLITFFITVTIFYVKNGPIVIYKNITHYTNIEIIGNRINIMYDVDNVDNCRKEISRWLWTYKTYKGIKTKVYVPLYNNYSALNKLGNSFLLSLPLPRGIWPGKWYYFSITENQCPFLPIFFQPDVEENYDFPLEVSQAQSDMSNNSN